VDTFDKFGVIRIDDHDRLRRDPFGADPSPDTKHWAGFTEAQKKKIRENRAPWLISDALNGYQPGLWDRWSFSLREAYRAFCLAWEASK
jgi:hypothetical protein